MYIISKAMRNFVAVRQLLVVTDTVPVVVSVNI